MEVVFIVDLDIICGVDKVILFGVGVVGFGMVWLCELGLVELMWLLI